MPSGSYMELSSPIHRLDAFVKLLSTLILLAAVILCSGAAEYLIIIASVVFIIRLSAIGLSNALGGIRRMWLFFIIIFLMNALFFESESPLWSWWRLTLSAEGIKQGINVVLRLCLAVVLGNLLVASTAPMEISSAIETLISPLVFVGVPTRDVSMILSAAIRFIPSFSEEAEMIRKAQIARGARFESRNLIERAKSLLPLVIPVFISAFRRADELSVAMEARGYRRTRNKFHLPKRKLRRADIIALILAALLCAVTIIL